MKEKERECKEELESRTRETRNRYESEIEKLSEYIAKIETESQQQALAFKQQEQERHRIEMRMVEVAEALKSERITFEKSLETANKEKQLEIQKVAEELLQLR